jgi:hypothetical protein
MATDGDEVSTLELKCSDYQIASGRITIRPRGKTFESQCGPLPEEKLKELEAAAFRHLTVRLLGPSTLLTLTSVRVTRLTGTHLVRITGRVIEPYPR